VQAGIEIRLRVSWSREPATGAEWAAKNAMRTALEIPLECLSLLR
jgi:hypothetical protein